MYLTQKNQIKGLTKKEYSTLRELCRLSKNLYNVGLYSVRQFYFDNQDYLRYESNYHACKSNENYQLLQTDIGQQTLKVVDRSMRSFFNLLKLARIGNYKYQQINLPRYLKKDGYFPLIMPRIIIKDGFFTVPMSREFKKTHKPVRIPFPKRLEGKKLKEVRIIPRQKAQWFQVEFITLGVSEVIDLDKDQALAIDLGLNNLATCVDTHGNSFIVDGKYLKSVNQWYNKLNAKYSRIKSHQDLKEFTNRQGRLLRKRDYQMRDYLSKTARLIVNYCLKKELGVLIIGTNKNWKQEINIGSRNNQNFVQIPHYSLRKKLSGLCERYGIEYIEQEESYTSKASALDNDDLPIYNANNSEKYKFSGKRVKRGLYQAKNGKLINADVNGAWNIGRKSKHNGFSVVSSGLLTSPLRITNLNVDLSHSN